MEKNCGISMVIATKGRVQLLENLVESIDRERSRYSGPTELLIVDDSSEQDAAAIRDMCERYDARYLFLTPSVSAKRNLGAREAQYPVVLFLDSDCLVTENILSEHARCYAENEKTGAVCGLLEFVGEGGQLFFYYKRLNAQQIAGTAVKPGKSVYVLPIPENDVEFGGYDN